MFRHPAYTKLFIGLVLTSVTLFAGSAFGQSPATRAGRQQKEVDVAQLSSNSDIPASGAKSAKPENKVAADEPKLNDLLNEVETLKAENTAVREMLRKMEEQQKAVLEQLDRLRVRLDGGSIAEAKPTAQPLTPSNTVEAKPPAINGIKDAIARNSGNATPQSPTDVGMKSRGGFYQDGIVIWQTGDDAKIPFLMRFQNNTQVRYLNTLSSNETFTDHLGVERDVHKRNDITVNRSMFVFNGYIFDKRARYNLTVWTSAGAASIVVAGNVGWEFNKALTLTGGYTGVPGSRSLVNTFPYFTSTDRTLADNFFRPGFTQGVWASGEPMKGWNYLLFLGNGLNTLNISAAKIDPHLVLSGSTWWEPLGDYGEPGKSRNMYDDYFATRKLRIRLGTSYTRSREDRFSNLDTANPENTSMYNSDGVLTFSTGAFAKGVTVEQATYRLWAIDGGLKWNGLAVNGQYYFRWVNDFKADGPLPLTSMFDHGFEASAGKFVIPKKLMMYLRGSAVFGEFRNSHEYAAGLKWHFVPSERLWLTAEVMRVQRAPYSGTFTPYTAGMSAWVPMIQTVIAF